jgi:hypothetical protein
VALAMVAVMAWIVAIAAGFVESTTEGSGFMRTVSNAGFYVGIVCASLVAAYVFFAGREGDED